MHVPSNELHGAICPVTLAVGLGLGATLLWIWAGRTKKFASVFRWFNNKERL